LANALRKVANVYLVTHIRNKNDILRKGLIEGQDFEVINSEKVARPLWKISNFIRGQNDKAWTIGTAISTISYYYFEHLVWKKFSKSINSGQYDIVHRITPLSPTIPSLIAYKCYKANVSFVIGPLNGGVPWPKEFRFAQHQEKEWLSYVRSAYKLLPGYRSTLKSSSAIILGSRYTMSQIPPKFTKKCFYLPENAVDINRFYGRAQKFDKNILRICFVGRLVPYKGPDMLIEALSPIIKDERVSLDIIGDGPLLPYIVKLIEREKLGKGIKIHGWVQHDQLQKIMCKNQVLALPSIREFGGGVVLEAMALGIIPIIIDYAGPSELVPDGLGFKIPLGQRQDIISNLRKTILSILKNPDSIYHRSKDVIEYVHKNFTWDVKSKQIVKIYDWVTFT